MGTTRTGSRLGIIAVVFVSAFVMLAPIVVFAQQWSDDEFQRQLELGIDESDAEQKTCAQEPRQPKCNPVCWTQEQCKAEKKSGVWEQSDESEKNCPSVAKKWGYCYPPNVETKLQIPIGGAKDVADVGQYIKTVYLFLLGIGGLVGAIVLIHAGFLWIVSGGNTGTIERAKKHIQDAAIGLLLLFGSYTILSALNPDLVRLRVPKAQLLRNIALEFEPVKPGREGGPCDASNEMAKAACAAACPGCECIPVAKDPMVALAEWTMWASAAIVTGGVAVEAAGGVGALMRLAGQKALSGTKTVFGLLKKIGGFAVSNPKLGFIGAAVGWESTKDFENWLDGQGVAMDDPGICIPIAKHILKKGELCATTNGCQEGLTCVATVKKITDREAVGNIGVCSDGLEGGACLSAEDCKNGLRCVDGPLGLKECAPPTGRAAGTVCGLGHGEQVCADGLQCKIVDNEFAFSFDEVGYGYCVSVADLAVEAARGSGLDSFKPRFIGDACQVAQGICPGEQNGLQLDYGLQCASIAQESRCTRVCEAHGDCTTGCPPGKECACREGRCVLGVQVQEAQIIQNGATGCSDQARFRCADGLVCTADPVPPLGNRYVCTDKALGSWCSNSDECGAELLCEDDPDAGTFKCVRE